MKREQLPLYALALAILVVGLAVAGVPVTTLFFGLVALACPLMMIFIMGGMHGGHSHGDGHGQPDEAPDQLNRRDDHTTHPPAVRDGGGALR